jgi:type I restriction enzyme, S subunit
MVVITSEENFDKTEIPNDWKYETLKGKIDIIHGYGFKSKYFKSRGNYILTTPGNFYEEGGFKELGKKQKFYDGIVSRKYLLQHGDMIVAMTEQTNGLLGSIAVIPKFGVYLHNQRLGKIKQISNEVITEYLYYVFNFEKFRNKVVKTSVGTKVKHTSPSKLLDIPIVFPLDKNEQQKISKVLLDIDSLIKQLNEIIKKKKNIKQGVMQELLTGKRRLEGFSEEWSSRLLGDMLDYEQPTKYLVKNIEYDDKYNTPVLTAGKSFILGYTPEENNTFQNVPVIIFDDFTTSSKYVDFSFKAKSSAMKILKLKNENVNLKFVYERIQLINFLVGVHKRYWISEFSNLSIKVPEFKEQNKISQIISDMELEINQLEAKKIKYNMIKQGIMQKLLTGEIRIK